MAFLNNFTLEGLLSAEITALTWDRIYLKLTVSLDQDLEPLTFYLVNEQGQAKAILPQEKDGKNRVLTLNVTNPGNCRCLPEGTYRLVICRGDDALCVPKVSPSLLPALSEVNKTFLYENETKGYALSFLETGFTVTDQPVSPMAESIKGKAKKLVKGAIKTGVTGVYTGTHLLKPKHQKTALFFTEQAEALSTNLRAVKDRMEERDLKGWTIETSTRSIVEKRSAYGIGSWLDVAVKLGKADVILVDDHAPILDWLTLRKDQTLIQLWHAGAGFKSSGYARWGHGSCPAPYGAHRQYTYGIAGSKRIAHFFSEVWGINEEQVLPTGMPRMDEYLYPAHRAEVEEALKKEFPQILGKKVILFAPTYRGTNHSDAHYPYELIDFNALYDFCGEEYVVLFKMHPWVPDAVPIPAGMEDKFLDLNHYQNINNLFYVTDLLITDYSSNIFEYSLMKKPMLFFAFDEAEYSISRGFHRNYKASAPGKVCASFPELMEALKTKDFQYEKVEDYIAQQFDYIDSGASDRVIDWLILGQLPEEFRKQLEQREELNRLLNEIQFTEVIS